MCVHSSVCELKRRKRRCALPGSKERRKETILQQRLYSVCHAASKGFVVVVVVSCADLPKSFYHSAWLIRNAISAAQPNSLLQQRKARRRRRRRREPRLPLLSRLTPLFPVCWTPKPRDPFPPTPLVSPFPSSISRPSFLLRLLLLLLLYNISIIRI